MHIRVVTSIQSIDPLAWRAVETFDFPFTDYAFLLALETSGSVSTETGWQPLYILAEDQRGIMGALCTYVKSHSYGEYIFDWEWARFYQQHGERYYPKLLAAVPFTPATGPRILLRADADKQWLRSQLIQSALQLAENSKMSSCHALFIAHEESDAFIGRGFALRHSFQYHWRNQGFRDFADYLDALLGKRRRDIARERLKAQSHGLTLECVNGSELTADHAAAMVKLYLNTTDKKSAIPYLHPSFFMHIFASMAPQIVLVCAKDQDEIVAASLNFYKGSKLFGRYWGSLRDYPDLHFELCYYQTIDFAIKNKLELFEAGAQGEHKIQRGFLPTVTLSAHKIFDPAFKAPIESYIHQEQQAIVQAMSDLSSRSPFKTQ